MAVIQVTDHVTEKRRLTAVLRSRLTSKISERRLVLVIVCLALLLDNMLYMVIVPIIPIYLDDMKKTEASTTLAPEDLAVTTTPASNASVFEPQGWRIPVLVTYRGDPERDSGVGILFASKAIVQLAVSPVAGTVIDRAGCSGPMLAGLAVIFLSTTVFAFGRSYGVLFAARSLQGVGSAFADTAGLAMIASEYRDADERTAAQSVALAFISFGCLVAPPFGGFLYRCAGKTVPFLVLSFVALVDGVLLKFLTGSSSKTRAAPSEAAGALMVATPIHRLVLDPYVALCSGALVMANVSLAFLEPTIARWMRDSMDADELRVGIVWLPAFGPHILGVYVAVRLARALRGGRRWLIPAAGLVLEGLGCLVLPFCDGFGPVVLPLMVICFGIALVDTSVLPTLAYLVDVRHTAVYGSVYAIADVAYCLAYAFGPVLADGVYQSVGFFWLNFGICASNLLYAPLLIFLKNVYEYSPLGSDFRVDNGGNSPEDSNSNEDKTLEHRDNEYEMSNLDQNEKDAKN